ncbi:MAG: hypothetical protein ACR2HS_00335, partial [Gammaproteobacteria bacterium]
RIESFALMKLKSSKLRRIENISINPKREIISTFRKNKNSFKKYLKLVKVLILFEKTRNRFKKLKI